jgi:methylmalonyl-CoA mutase C-terminal domain/subunit
VDVVGLSSLAGAHKYLFPRVVELLREKGARDVLVIAGGIIPQEDIPFLSEMGIAAIFGPGSSIKQIADYIREKTRPKFNPKTSKPK